MGKKKILYEETYRKGVVIDKNDVINWIKQNDSELTAIKAGKNDDGTDFVQVKIDNIKD